MVRGKKPYQGRIYTPDNIDIKLSRFIKHPHTFAYRVRYDSVEMRPYIIEAEPSIFAPAEPLRNGYSSEAARSSQGYVPSLKIKSVLAFLPYHTKN